MNLADCRRTVYQPVLFAFVGALATLTHWLSAQAAVVGLGAPPALASFLGWCVGFTVSYKGHCILTFRGHAASASSALPRFLCISTCGLLVCECGCTLLAEVFSMRFEVALAIMLIFVAIGTLILSRAWAFAPVTSRQKSQLNSIETHFRSVE